ncbi:hypothetical protein FQR65_LT13694 [Abscondita terminalis]|nr:hypothetical protein FQR65_LT13694 [Abscondita terminalis]
MASSKLLRVTQLDALYLDREIFKMLLQLLQDITSYLPPKFSASYTTEMELMLKFLILNYSVMRGGNTFGQQLLAIKYENMTSTKGILYTIFSCINYLPKINLMTHFPNCFKIIFQLEVFFKVCAFINMTYFLKTGKYPHLIDRILGLNQVYGHNVERTFGSKYLARELLWNGFIEILVYVIPLLNYHKLKRVFLKVLSMPKRTSLECSEVSYTSQTKCTHCGMSPILPYRMNCPHVFCYTCLKGNQIADPQYECPVCLSPNIGATCDRVTVA